MKVSEVKGFKYKEYRHPRLERFVTTCTYVIELSAVILATLLIGIIFTWLVAPIFPFLYDFLHRMKRHSIYFYDDKGLGPSISETFVEDFAHSMQSMAFCVLTAWTISLVI